MARDVDPLQALEDDFVEAVCRETGLKPELARHYVAPVIRHLEGEYAGDRLYIPARRRRLPVDEIRAAFAEVKDASAVCERFAISRRTLYRLLDPDDVVDNVA